MLITNIKIITINYSLIITKSFNNEATIIKKQIYIKFHLLENINYQQRVLSTNKDE